MSQGEKIQILLNCIEQNMELAAGQREMIYKSLLEGQIKIVQAEEAYREAVEPYHYFPVELVPEGFAFWDCGGYENGRGHAVTAAGHNRQALRTLRTMRERNGRHVLKIVYQGCFMVQAEVNRDGGEYIELYQITGFTGKDSGCTARCQRLYVTTPSGTFSKMEDGAAARFSTIFRDACQMAGTEDNYGTRR